MFLDYGLDDLQSIKHGILEISLPVHLSHLSNSVAVATFSRDVLTFVFSRKQAACDWIIHDDVKTILLAGRDELMLQ
jgi:hypothetical protein